jgi:hypothetical protein
MSMWRTEKHEWEESEKRVMVGLGCLGGGGSDHHRETDSGIERLSSAGGGRPGGSAAPPPGGNGRLVSRLQTRFFLPEIIQNSAAVDNNFFRSLILNVGSFSTPVGKIVLFN